MTANLHIETSLRNGITILTKSYAMAPFKVADITEDKSSRSLRLMLMSSSPGVLDGDHYNMSICLAKGCSLHLETQSYQRLFSMKDKASQAFVLNQAEHSSFCFLPHPVVPHKGSSFFSKTTIYLSTGCSLLWGEVLTCGRNINEERFLLQSYQSLTEVFLNKRLLIRENLLLNPSAADPALPGKLEGFTHQATMIYIAGSSARDVLKTQTRAYLSNQSNIIYGVTDAPVKGLVIKILGFKAEQLHNCLKKIAAILEPVNNVKPVIYGR